jgi:hypothetical protein
VAYQPAQSPVQIDASATIEVVVTMMPGEVAFWKSRGNSDTNMLNYRIAREASLRNDLATTGLFARIVADNEQADYNVKLEWSHDRSGETETVQVTLTATRTKTGERAIAAMKGGDKDLTVDLMTKLKTTLAAGMQARITQEQTVLFAKSSLPELLASSDANSACASARNRALIAAKIQQLPALLREKKTEELTALVVKIEQTELDLNHGSEMAKDRAQQMAAENSAAPQIAELRGLAISYQERIELLKPMAVALKEEIANRNR